MSDKLTHYGTPRHSGRYPWGSGDDPYQNNKSFLAYVDKLKKEGLSEVQIAEGLGINTTQLRAKKSIAKSEIRKEDAGFALRLKDKGYSNTAIGQRMGINESSVRALLNPALQERSDMTNATAEILKQNLKDKPYLDIGVGVERHMGISRTKLKTSIALLEEEGYKIHYVPVTQLGTGKKTSMMVLTEPGVEYKEVYQNKDQIRTITDFSEDGGRSYLGLQTPKDISSNRIMVRYGDQGGADKDGVIELRRGVDELSLGNAKYAQVRVAVDGTHFLKGMAIYTDDIPPGIDIIYNVNKDSSHGKLDVMKKMKDDPDNPFGSTVRQKHYVDNKGITSLSALNVVNEEGDWGEWSKTLSSQMLSKQNPTLAKKQLDMVFDIKAEELAEIKNLTNPAVKKKLLESFADDCDSSSVHLKAAALPRQGSHVILPFPDMKENEIYAPNYRDGEKVVLIRYPHGGTFEIPELTVNNKHKTANAIMKQAKDGVGIHPKTAERLSGADFDGDTVLVIPNNNREIKTSSPLKGLQNFDPKVSYPAYEGMPKMSPRTKQMQMGNVSNLITDMTIKGANTDEIARAVRHSMVVIDAEKHHLNYKQSFIDNGIGALKKKYQGSERSGASTLISKASSDIRVGDRKESIDKDTGKKIYEYTNESYVNKQGKEVTRLIKSTKMAEATDAFSLSSGTPMEKVYATHANKLKAMANEARKEAIQTTPTPYSPSAKRAYEKEVASLRAHLNVALKNAPLERQAQVLANSVVAMKKDANPGMDSADLKKIKGQALAEARTRTGAKKQRIEISDREWQAIQSGAVSHNTLTQIINNTDLDKLKQLATPRNAKSITSAKEKRAKAMLNNGYTQAEIADALGLSVSVISKLAD